MTDDDDVTHRTRASFCTAKAADRTIIKSYFCGGGRDIKAGATAHKQTDSN